MQPGLAANNNSRAGWGWDRGAGWGCGREQGQDGAVGEEQDGAVPVSSRAGWGCQLHWGLWASLGSSVLQASSPASKGKCEITHPPEHGQSPPSFLRAHLGGLPSMPRPWGWTAGAWPGPVFALGGEVAWSQAQIHTEGVTGWTEAALPMRKSAWSFQWQQLIQKYLFIHCQALWKGPELLLTPAFPGHQDEQK